MFRPLTGFKATYDDLTLVVAAEFDEWRVVVHSPQVIIQGQRQYKEVKAKEHALALAQMYFKDVKLEAARDLPLPEWQPTGLQDWLVWQV